MRFLCLGYAEEAVWEAMPKGEQDTLVEACFAYDEIMHKNGQWVDAGNALQPSGTAKTLRWNGERVVVTDGPFAETKEQLGGLGTVEARDMNHAIEILSKHPGLRFGPFEIRPVDEAMNKRYAERQKLPKPRKIFVNLSVKDLNRSIAFFTKLGFTFNPQFTDETATCMIVAGDIFVMLLTEAKFQEFTPKAIADATKTSEVLVAISCEDRSEVDRLVAAAKAAGGSTYADARDYGFMYQHGFQDLDGHIWELVWMDPQFVPPQAGS
ncbi:MAG: hypothetical protein DCC68_15985 [Planctomycetota bacterium]|nr:MAG: hypothetical protein DCC68_15985 [Planctomycetota bacterium]